MLKAPELFRRGLGHDHPQRVRPRPPPAGAGHGRSGAPGLFVRCCTPRAMAATVAHSASLKVQHCRAALIPSRNAESKWNRKKTNPAVTRHALGYPSAVRSNSLRSSSPPRRIQPERDPTPPILNMCPFRPETVATPPRRATHVSTPCAVRARAMRRRSSFLVGSFEVVS